MGNNIKYFLGRRPLKVITDYTELSEKHANTFESVNNYLLEAQSSTGVFMDLGINRTSQFRLTTPIIQVSKEEYYIPIKCAFEINLMATKTAKMRNAVYAPSDLFYIKGLVSRPNLGHLMKHFQKLLSSEYAGRIDGPLPGSMGNRYTVCLSNAKTAFIITLLHLATTGGGKVIDFSWIAPLQELLESKEEEELKRKSKTGRGLPATPRFGLEDDPGGIPEDDHWHDPLDLPPLPSSLSEAKHAQIKSVKEALLRATVPTASRWR